MTRTDAGGERRAVDRQRSGLVLLAVCLGNALSMFNSTMVNVVLPDVQTELGASDTGLQWVSTSYTLCYAAMLLPAGALGNRIGRRPTFLLGVAVFAVGSLGCLLAPSFGLLLTARVVQALGCALLLPQTLTIIVNEYADAGARARAVGMWSGVSSIGLAAGPVLGGLFLGFADWRWGFGLSAVLGLAVLLIGLRAIPTARHGRIEGAPPIDVAGAGIAVVALLALVFGLIESRNLGWSSPVIIGALVLAAVAIAGFLRLEQRLGARGRHPLMPLGIWRSPRLVAANVAGLAYFFLFFGVLFFVSLALQHDGFSALLTGVAFLPMLLIQGAVGLLSGRLVARFGPTRILMAGFTGSTIGAVLLALLPAAPAFLDLEWRLAVLGIGCGLMSSPMSNLAVTSVERIHSGTASAVHTTCRQIGSTLAVATLGLIPASADFGPGLQWAMGATALLLACSGAAVWLLTLTGARRRVAAHLASNAG